MLLASARSSTTGCVSTLATFPNLYPRCSRLLRLLAARTVTGVGRSNIIGVISPALVQACSKENVLAGFRRTGIDPINAYAITDDDLKVGKAVHKTLAAAGPLLAGAAAQAERTAMKQELTALPNSEALLNAAAGALDLGLEKKSNSTAGAHPEAKLSPVDQLILDSIMQRPPCAEPLLPPMRSKTRGFNHIRIQYDANRGTLLTSDEMKRLCDEKLAEYKEKEESKKRKKDAKEVKKQQKAKSKADREVNKAAKDAARVEKKAQKDKEKKEKALVREAKRKSAAEKKIAVEERKKAAVEERKKAALEKKEGKRSKQKKASNGDADGDETMRSSSSSAASESSKAANSSKADSKSSKASAGASKESKDSSVAAETKSAASKKSKPKPNLELEASQDDNEANSSDSESSMEDESSGESSSDDEADLADSKRASKAGRKRGAATAKDVPAKAAKLVSSSNIVISKGDHLVIEALDDPIGQRFWIAKAVDDVNTKDKPNGVDFELEWWRSASGEFGTYKPYFVKDGNESKPWREIRNSKIVLMTFELPRSGKLPPAIKQAIVEHFEGNHA
jgi:hypothetical protein